MNRVPLRMGDEDYDTLQTLSKASNRSMNNYIVELIRAAAKAEKEKTK